MLNGINWGDRGEMENCWNYNFVKVTVFGVGMKELFSPMTIGQ
jgi:hypothetical protein